MKHLERAWWGSQPCPWVLSAQQFIDWGHTKNLSLPGALAWFREHKRMDRFGSKWAQLKHVTYSTFLHSPCSSFYSSNSSSEALEGSSWRNSVFTIFCLSCNMLFASYSHWALKFPYSKVLTFFQQETPEDVFSLPRCLLPFYWLTESLNLKVSFFPLPFASSLCNPNTSLIGKCKTGSELFLYSVERWSWLAFNFVLNSSL